MNQINVIAPYRHNGMWVFDDERVGLSREPFVAGIDTMIDQVTEGIADAVNGFVMVFSKDPFPTAQRTLTFVKAESGGAVYHDQELGLAGWLCPALFKYFKRAPKRLYIEVRPKPAG